MTILTPTQIRQIADKYYQRWLETDIESPTYEDLRTIMSAAITEALEQQSEQYASGAATLRHERDAALQKQPINTHRRLFDLVRNCRAQLHEEDLITDDEYAWLCSHEFKEDKGKPGSPSPRRLEDYDDLRQLLAVAERARDQAQEELNALRMHLEVGH
jgi:hypothetical protein